jgi:hypothetical protein
MGKKPGNFVRPSLGTLLAGYPVPTEYGHRPVFSPKAAGFLSRAPAAEGDQTHASNYTATGYGYLVGRVEDCEDYICIVACILQRKAHGISKRSNEPGGITTPGIDVSRQSQRRGSLPGLEHSSVVQRLPGQAEQCGIVRLARWQGNYGVSRAGNWAIAQVAG